MASYKIFMNHLTLGKYVMFQLKNQFVQIYLEIVVQILEGSFSNMVYFKFEPILVKTAFWRDTRYIVQQQRNVLGATRI